MVGQAFAPEYRGALGELSVNASYADVLQQARERSRHSTNGGEFAQARLAEAEACRRLGELTAAEEAWRSSYRASQHREDRAGMAWALWSGGTLARQRGRMRLALRWLVRGRDFAWEAGDLLAHGYTRAGIAETLRIQGDYVRARPLHEELLAEARQRGECRHIVWSLEGLAQIDRQEGDLSAAWDRFSEAQRVAEEGGDDRGSAWALRGMADVRSLFGEHEEPLRLLTRGERICRDMRLDSALAYNRKMRGNVLFRACWHGEAARVYEDACQRFAELHEPRGLLLARLGLVKSRARLGRPRSETERHLRELRDTAQGHDLPGLTRLVTEAAAEFCPDASL
ncbi:hypothetical protein GCM10027174_02780 [Salinifilum aidingensis]